MCTDVWLMSNYTPLSVTQLNIIGTMLFEKNFLFEREEGWAQRRLKSRFFFLSTFFLSQIRASFSIIVLKVEQKLSSVFLSNCSYLKKNVFRTHFFLHLIYGPWLVWRPQAPGNIIQFLQTCVTSRPKTCVIATSRPRPEL